MVLCACGSRRSSGLTCYFYMVGWWAARGADLVKCLKYGAAQRSTLSADVVGRSYVVGQGVVGLVAVAFSGSSIERVGCFEVWRRGKVRLVAVTQCSAVR